MKKSSIKSIYHWSIMGLIMGMPLIITACSYIPNAYNENNVIKYESYESVSSLVSGETYHFNIDTTITGNSNSLYYSSITNLNITSSVTFDSFEVPGRFRLYDNGNGLYLWNTSTPSHYAFIGSFDFTYLYQGGDDGIDNILPYISKLTYHEVVNNGAYQVHQFNKWFVNRPINIWYNTLLEKTIGINEEFTPINNLLYFPLYGLWVLIFDLMFDCFAVIPSICHSWFNKMKGEEE